MATQVPNSRLIRDNALTITKALPGASSNNTSDPIDLGSGPFNPEEITVEVSYPAMPLHVTAGNSVDITLYHSDTTTVTTATTPLIKASVIGVASTGSVATVLRFKLPPGTKRYIAFYQATGATDTLTTYSMTYSILV